MRELLHPVGIVLPAEHLVDDRHVAEQIGDDAMVRLAFDVVEQDRAAAIHVLLQAGDLQIGIDFLVGLDQFALGAQPLQRAAQIEGLVRRGYRRFVPCARAVALIAFPLHRFLSNYPHGTPDLSTPMPQRPCQALTRISHASMTAELAAAAVVRLSGARRAPRFSAAPGTAHRRLRRGARPMVFPAGAYGSPTGCRNANYRPASA